MAIELFPVLKNGTVDTIDIASSPDLQRILPEIIANYGRAGFEQPWTSYAAVNEQNIVGVCAFKTPARNGRVEIAYFTFPQFENQGFATQMAQCLVQITRDTDDSLQIIARTMPIEGASARVLRKSGFVRTGEVLDPEDGLVWEWEYSKQNS